MRAVQRLRRGLILILCSLVAGAAAVVSSSGRAARADGLLSFGVETAARGLQAFQDDGTGSRSVEGDVPETTADLRSGPVGRAFSSVVWPGPVVANVGSLVKFLAPQLPDQVKLLNDPVRAEAATGQQPPTSTFSAANITMSATASDQLVEARATVGGVTGQAAPTSGYTTVASSSLNAGQPKGYASASAVDIRIAGGLVRVASITSTATAGSDGATGTGTATTVISGLEIAGQPVSVDERGVHVGNAQTGLNSFANQIVHQALAAARIEVSIGTPSKVVQGATASFTAPALVVTARSPSGVVVLTLGGAEASVTAVPDQGGAVTGPDAAGAGPVVPSAITPASAPAGSGSPLAQSPGPPAPSVVVNNRRASVALDAVFDDRRRIRPSQVLLALLATALLSLGLRRLYRDTIGGGPAGCGIGGTQR
jgi:hypothetical protein